MDHPAAAPADAGVRLSRLNCGILGPLRVVADGRALDPGPRKQQIVLAALLCHANTPVSVDALVDALWQARPPRTARKNIQVYICTLRSLLGRGASGISHQMAGYVLHVEDDELDVLAFDRHTRLGRNLRHGGQPAAGARALGEALALWRGPVLAGLRDVPMLADAAERLEQRLLGALEDWAEAELSVDGEAAEWGGSRGTANGAAAGVDRSGGNGLARAGSCGCASGAAAPAERLGGGSGWTGSGEAAGVVERVGGNHDWAVNGPTPGGAAAVAERIAEVARRHPFRERLRKLEMSALCQAGRRSEALAVYDELRRSLAREFGLGPSPAMEAFYRAMLRDDQPVPARPVIRGAGRAGAGGAGAAQAGVAPASSGPARLAPTRRRTSATLLPRDLPAFTGRTDCTRHLMDALTVGGERIAVVAGPVGVGKTAFAVHVAHQLGADFPDGRFLVRLRDADGGLRPPDEVLAELLWAADAPAWPGRQGDVRIRWRHWAATHRALLVVDDARHPSEIRPFLPDIGPGAAIVTARTRLAGLEPAHRLRLPPFTPDEAIEFLGQVLGPDRIAADRPAATRIATAAGLLPLGLRAAADRLAWLSHLPLADHLSRLEHGTALLDEVAAGDAPIRARLARAVGDLPEPARSAFPGLGTLGQRFTLDQAAAAWRLGADATARLLESLLETSMIAVPTVGASAHSMVYETPALVHAYARELVEAADEPAGPRIIGLAS